MDSIAAIACFWRLPAPRAPVRTKVPRPCAMSTAPSRISAS
jgi:hypothetical protein